MLFDQLQGAEQADINWNIPFAEATLLKASSFAGFLMRDDKPVYTQIDSKVGSIFDNIKF